MRIARGFVVLRPALRVLFDLFPPLELAAVKHRFNDPSRVVLFVLHVVHLDELAGQRADIRVDQNGTLHREPQIDMIVTVHFIKSADELRKRRALAAVVKPLRFVQKNCRRGRDILRGDAVVGKPHVKAVYEVRLERLFVSRLKAHFVIGEDRRLVRHGERLSAVLVRLRDERARLIQTDDPLTAVHPFQKICIERRFPAPRRTENYRDHLLSPATV